MNDYTARFLCHEAHVRGVSDTGILELPEWAWLGLETAEVPGILGRLSASSGDFLAVEQSLQGRCTAPLVILYHGVRSGNTILRFLGEYPEDGNYRSLMIGG